MASASGGNVVVVPLAERGHQELAAEIDRTVDLRGLL
jgi:hypothetical protein